MAADFSKKMVCVNFADACLRAIKHEWLVIAALLLPFVNGLGRDTLDAQLHPRHVVRGIDHEE